MILVVLLMASTPSPPGSAPSSPAALTPASSPLREPASSPAALLCESSSEADFGSRPSSPFRHDESPPPSPEGAEPKRAKYQLDNPSVRVLLH